MFFQYQCPEKTDMLKLGGSIPDIVNIVLTICAVAQIAMLCLGITGFCCFNIHARCYLKFRFNPFSNGLLYNTAFIIAHLYRKNQRRYASGLVLEIEADGAVG